MEYFAIGHSLFGVLRFVAIRERPAHVVRFGHTLRQATLASTYLAEGLSSP